MCCVYIYQEEDRYLISGIEMAEIFSQCIYENYQSYVPLSEFVIDPLKSNTIECVNDFKYFYANFLNEISCAEEGCFAFIKKRRRKLQIWEIDALLYYNQFGHIRNTEHISFDALAKHFSYITALSCKDDHLLYHLLERKTGIKEIGLYDRFFKDGLLIINQQVYLYGKLKYEHEIYDAHQFPVQKRLVIQDGKVVAKSLANHIVPKTRKISIRKDQNYCYFENIDILDLLSQNQEEGYYIIDEQNRYIEVYDFEKPDSRFCILKMKEQTPIECISKEILINFLVFFQKGVVYDRNILNLIDFMIRIDGKKSCLASRFNWEKLCLTIFKEYQGWEQIAIDRMKDGITLIAEEENNRIIEVQYRGEHYERL